MDPHQRRADPGAAWLLFSPEGTPRVDLARWAQQAATFFSAELELRESLTDPTGLLPERAAMTFRVRALGREAAGATWVRVATAPLAEAPAARAAAESGVRAIGGAGFDALLLRARRLWSVDARAVSGDDPRAPMVMAGVLAMVLLAPVVPPAGGTIFGVRGVRVGLAAAGWPERVSAG
jgi:hypothetical protein